MRRFNSRRDGGGHFSRRTWLPKVRVCRKFDQKHVRRRTGCLLSLSFSSLLAVRNVFTFVSVGYEFVRDLRSAVVHRHRGTLKVRFRKNEESENKKRKKFQFLIIRQRNKVEKTIR